MDFYERYLAENLEKPEFEQAWKETELEYIIAKNIIKRRKTLHLSQCDLAIQIKSKQSVISRIESGQQNVTLKSLKLLAEALETSVPSLMSDFDGDQEDVEKRKYRLVKS